MGPLLSEQLMSVSTTSHWVLYMHQFIPPSRPHPLACKVLTVTVLLMGQEAAACGDKMT